MKPLLINIDVQESWSVPAVTQAIQEFSDKARRHMPVLWVYFDKGPTTPFRLGNLANDFNRMSIPTMHPDDWIMFKKHRDAFDETKLEFFMRSSGFDTSLLTGYGTLQCALSSGEGSVAAGFDTTIFSNLTSDGPHPCPVDPTFGFYHKAGIKVMHSADYKL